MSKANNADAQTIDLTIGSTDFVFEVTRQAYNKYINSIAPNNKVAPSHNFLVSTVKADSKAALVEFIRNTPGCEVQLVGALLEEYTPDLVITAKKRTA